MPLAGADILPWVEGRAVAVEIGLTTTGPPGSEAGARAQGRPRNRGDPVCSVDEHGAGIAETHPMLADVPCRTEDGRERAAGRRYRRARQMSAVGWAAGSRSASLYQRTWGTGPTGPSGGKGAP